MGGHMTARRHQRRVSVVSKALPARWVLCAVSMVLDGGHVLCAGMAAACCSEGQGRHTGMYSARAWRRPLPPKGRHSPCLLYTSDAADDLTRVDLGGRRIIDKK